MILQMNLQPIEDAPLGVWILGFGEPYDEDTPPFGAIKGKKVTYEQWDMVSDTRKEIVVTTQIEWEGAYIWPTHWCVPELPIPENRP